LKTPEAADASERQDAAQAAFEAGVVSSRQDTPIDDYEVAANSEPQETALALDASEAADALERQDAPQAASNTAVVTSGPQDASHDASQDTPIDDDEFAVDLQPQETALDASEAADAFERQDAPQAACNTALVISGLQDASHDASNAAVINSVPQAVVLVSSGVADHNESHAVALEEIVGLDVAGVAHHGEVQDTAPDSSSDVNRSCWEDAPLASSSDALHASPLDLQYMFDKFVVGSNVARLMNNAAHHVSKTEVPDGLKESQFCCQGSIPTGTSTGGHDGATSDSTLSPRLSQFVPLVSVSITPRLSNLVPGDSELKDFVPDVQSNEGDSLELRHFVPDLHCGGDKPAVRHVY